MAALRILLSDTPAELTTLPHSAAAAPPVDLSIITNSYTAGYPSGEPLPRRPPLAGSPAGAYTLVTENTLPIDVHKTLGSVPLIGGFIKIEQQRINGVWHDVTQEILALGIAGKSLANNTPATPIANRWNAPGTTCADRTRPRSSGSSACAIRPLLRSRRTPARPPRCPAAIPPPPPPERLRHVSDRPTDYWPMALYDTREGSVRDGVTSTDLALGGVMNYIELDVNNLRRWILGQIGTTGTLTRNENGYIIYFSDRRNNKSNSRR